MRHLLIKQDPKDWTIMCFEIKCIAGFLKIVWNASTCCFHLVILMNNLQCNFFPEIWTAGNHTFLSIQQDHVYFAKMSLENAYDSVALAHFL